MGKTKLILTGLNIVFIFFFNSCQGSTNNKTRELTNIEKSIAVLQAIQTGNVSAMKNYINPETYIQHNLSYPNGVDAIIEATKSGVFKGTLINTFRSFKDNDIVVLHSEYGGTWNKGVPQVVFDVFRFENDLIVEHWDNLSNVQDDKDGTSQLNGMLTPAINIKKTETNKAIVIEAGQKIFIKGLYSTIGNYFNEYNYIQHSVGYGTNIKPLLGFLSTLSEGTPFYQSIKSIHVQGNFALMMSQGFPDSKLGLPSAYFDLFRLEEGKIVEHWDCIQTIPSKTDWANSNGKW